MKTNLLRKREGRRVKKQIYCGKEERNGSEKGEENSDEKKKKGGVRRAKTQSYKEEENTGREKGEVENLLRKRGLEGREYR